MKICIKDLCVAFHILYMRFELAFGRISLTGRLLGRMIRPRPQNATADNRGKPAKAKNATANEMFACVRVVFLLLRGANGVVNWRG